MYLQSFSPGGPGEAHGEAELCTVLWGVEWLDDGPLFGSGGTPNKSPSRSVVAAAAAGGWVTGGGCLIASPSKPRRSTSPDGSGPAGVGEG